MTIPLQQVHVRVNDAATGKPTPCRIHFSGPDGSYYAPYGRLSNLQVNWSKGCAGNLLRNKQPWAYIDGACEIRLPVGSINVEVAKGPEYKPLLEQLNLMKGKSALRLTIERWINLREEGWYAGEGGENFIDPHGALLEGAAEDLAVVNLLASMRGAVYYNTPVAGAPPYEAFDFPNLLAFSGQEPCLSLPGHLVVVNTRNHHPVLGSLDLLNCHRVVYPLAFGGSAGPDDWTLADWCGQCHRKQGLVVWHVGPGSLLENHFVGEALADAMLGHIDAVNISLNHPVGWYELLNCGLRLPLLCGGCRASIDHQLGNPRTYARLKPGEEFNYKNWIEAVRAGRTFAAHGSGPFLTLEASGTEVGGIVELAEAGQSLEVKGTLRSLKYKKQLQLIFNGEIIATGDQEIVEQVPISASGWLALRCASGNRIVAHTSPIYVTVAGQPPKPSQSLVQHLLGQMDRMKQWVVEQARCPDETHRARLLAIFDEARGILLRLLDR